MLFVLTVVLVLNELTIATNTKGGTQISKKFKTDSEFSRQFFCLSQPEPQAPDPDVEDNFGPDNFQDIPDGDLVNRRCPVFSFSQPAAKIDDFFLGSQLGAASNSSQSPPICRWVKRMTRFCVNISVDETLKQLVAVVEELGFVYKIQHIPLCVTISTVDKRKHPLVFKANIVDMGNQLVLLDFRLSRGDGIEFKRHFVMFKNSQLSRNQWLGPMSFI